MVPTARLLALTLSLALLPLPAEAAMVFVFDRGTIAFYVLVGIVTGAVAWWRGNEGDGLIAVVVWSILLIVGLSFIRYTPKEIWLFASEW